MLPKGWTEDAHYILADSSLTDDRIRVLKHGDTFAVFDHYGNIRPIATGEDGLYHEGTRFLSSLLIEIEGTRPFFLSSTVRDDNDQLVVALTNPDLRCGDSHHLPLGSLHIARRIFLWDGCCYQEIAVENYGQEPVETSLCVRVAADYADIYEIRGMARIGRGQDLPSTIRGQTLTLSYRGLDQLVRETKIEFSSPSVVTSVVTPAGAHFDLVLTPRQQIKIYITVRCEKGTDVPAPMLSFDEGRTRVLSQIAAHKADSCAIQSSNGQFQAWISRAFSDLHMMSTNLPTGPYPYAGVPWFNTPFGRDGIVTAFECLWFWPELARGVLTYLAKTQATEIVPEEDAEPGKILHETRNGEMAALKEMPFGRYYGSVDGTPLFVLLAGAYYRRTGDLGLVEKIWPNIEAALAWVDTFGDRDGDGFVEYSRLSGSGLLHQGWKDADDAIMHANGSIADGPIALCEVQGYVYGAWRAASELASALGLEDESAAWSEKADRLQVEFNRAFWCEELSTFALALDGKKDRCRVRSSNAGQGLFTGIADGDKARRVTEGLVRPESFSGWGIRTLAEGEARYNPMAYHNGSVWPHDNALIALGFARYGFVTEALQVFKGLFEAAMYFDLHRMPELFCGFGQQTGEGPVLYPVACSPQAWSAASVFLLFQATLGLTIDGVRGRVSFVRPALPDFLDKVEITNLRVAGSTLDLLLVRYHNDVSVTVLRREGDAEVIVVK
ncbi:MAG: amylo-alpha-1,6-glucosidase [Bryobacteraceae bacterium]|nr:amylo-alpha-1,6-glucosidase [Bryobacteraceae bacterium]